MTYFNEIDPFCSKWLQNLYPDATIDARDIREVEHADGSERCHFFAGIGGWEHALSLAEWPASRPVWTGSCPCQPFSAAGNRLGESDPRHLWPEFRRLIEIGQPAIVFGEQVASADGRDWLARVRADLEVLGYAVGAADLAAASVGAPHIRQRLYWVAYAERTGRERPRANINGSDSWSNWRNDLGWCSPARGLEQPTSDGREQRRAEPVGRGLESRCGDSGLADASGSRWNGRASVSGREAQGGDAATRTGEVSAVGLEQPDSERCEAGSGYDTTGPQSFWADYDLIPCLDGKARRIEPGTFPLAHGVPRRVALLRAYGNAIVPPVAATFIRAFMETQFGGVCLSTDGQSHIDLATV